MRVGPEAKPVEDSEDSIVLAAGGSKTTRDDDDDANLTAERAAILARRENSRASVIDTIEQFTVDAVDAACEGLVLKRLDGARARTRRPYAPSPGSNSSATTARRYGAPATRWTSCRSALARERAQGGVVLAVPAGGVRPDERDLR